MTLDQTNSREGYMMELPGSFLLHKRLYIAISITYFFLNLESSLLELKVDVAGDLDWVLIAGVVEELEVVFPDVDKLVGSTVSFGGSSLESFLSSFPFFKSFNAEAGTLGVLTGSIGELVRDRDPKNRDGFSGLTFGGVSNFARPLATAPESIPKLDRYVDTYITHTTYTASKGSFLLPLCME